MVNLCNETEVATDLLLSRLQRLDRLPMLQHDLRRRYLHLTIRTHLPGWILQLGRLNTIDGHPEETKRSEQWITDPPSQGKRSNSPATRASDPAPRGEALSYHPSLHSPAVSPEESMTYNPAGFNLEIYRGGQPRQVEHVELGEQRMVVKMTMSEYHPLMKEFEAHIAKARGVGRDK